ncbi:hypothetical protein [Pedobacter mendelii]|uniref:Outer membrane protein beta-barrel domain-containing protein n=1 Tax=Pedobacter mendelii TaxID=1908240 RepID=A0ABQ2BF35_9SPHI|nr:hypothetical protein [Pedobacter mendelii]GGI24679.1 hypothetical protein GCM10008119_13860 [Pedobacter mendelii]
MKKQLLITAMAVLCLGMTGFAQTKGTNALSFGINATTNKNSYKNLNQTEQITEQKSNLFSLGYGYFIKDNSKIGIEATYSQNTINSTGVTEQTFKSYGGNVSYQKYFPIVKTLFAYAGGKAGYAHGTQNQSQPLNSNNISQDYTSNSYTLGAYGGVTWFLGKRFALETSLLSADIAYNSTEQTQGTNLTAYTSKNTSFNFNSQGFINNLGFKIYILF